MVFNFQKFANHPEHTKLMSLHHHSSCPWGPGVLVTDDGGSECEILMSCMFCCICCMDILSPCDVCINMSPANDSHTLGGPNIGTTPHPHQAPLGIYWKTLFCQGTFYCFFSAIFMIKGCQPFSCPTATFSISPHFCQIITSN